jgi:hypothetical protein
MRLQQGSLSALRQWSPCTKSGVRRAVGLVCRGTAGAPRRPRRADAATPHPEAPQAAPTPAAAPPAAAQDAPVDSRRAAFDAAMRRLDPEQRAAVEARHAHLRCIALPGSGKTTVLTSRVAHLLLNPGSSGQQYPLQPWNILAITFTK